MKKYILVVDDEKSMQDLLKMGLEDKGYNVRVVNDGQVAKKVLEKEDIDLVVSDLRMQKVSGLELLKWVKKKYPYIPFILITAYATVDNAVEAMKLGVTDYITKPFKFDNFLGIIKDAFSIKTTRPAYLPHDSFIGDSEGVKNLLEQVIVGSS